MGSIYAWLQRQSWARKIGATLFPVPPALGQGPHPDPLDPATPAPDPQSWPGIRQEAFASTEMEWFRASLLLPGVADVRAAVLDDLSSYTGLPPDQCVERCQNWESWSVEEWFAADRSDMGGLTDFYRTTESWAFDLLWYAYLQAEGYGYPTSVLALRAVAGRGHGRVHLDFGSGVGVTSQLFARAGYETTLADLSTSLLDFARYRLSRRGRRPSSLTSMMRSLRPVGTMSLQRSTRSPTFLIWPTSWPVCMVRSGPGGGWLPTSIYVPRRRRTPHFFTKMTSISGRCCTARGSCRPVASGDTQSTVAWTLRTHLRSSGCCSTASFLPAVPIVSSVARSNTWRPADRRAPTRSAVSCTNVAGEHARRRLPIGVVYEPLRSRRPGGPGRRGRAGRGLSRPESGAGSAGRGAAARRRLDDCKENPSSTSPLTPEPGAANCSTCAGPTST